MKYAVIQLAGQQLKVAEGETITVTKMDSYEPVVLAFSADDSLELGSPTLTDVAIKLTPQAESKEKTTVFRYKSKSRYRKTKGHKQPFVTLKVDSITKGKKSEKATKAKSSQNKEESTEATK